MDRFRYAMCPCAHCLLLPGRPARSVNGEDDQDIRSKGTRKLKSDALPWGNSAGGAVCLRANRVSWRLATGMEGLKFGGCRRLILRGVLVELYANLHRFVLLQHLQNGDENFGSRVTGMKRRRSGLLANISGYRL